MRGSSLTLLLATLAGAPVLAATLPRAVEEPARGVDERGGIDDRAREREGPLDVDAGTLGSLPGAHDAAAERAARLAVERGLAWLAARQAETPDGGFPSAGAKDLYPSLGVAALGALAFMAGGSTPERGPHGAEVRKAIEYLLARVDWEEGSPTRGYVSDANDQASQMHGHGLATLALAEAYAVSPGAPLGRRIGEALPLAVGLIERAQGAEGGWMYRPTRQLEHENSVTITLVQALRAARNSGIRVDPQVIARAVDYVQRTQQEDGMFRYGLGSGDSSVALTAAGISTLNAAGRYSGPHVAQGYDALLRELEARELALEGRALTSGFPCYERLYVAQALWQHRDPAVFERWIQDERRELVGSQDADGSWTGAGQEQRYGRTYATAVNVLVLALPDQLLPIFQR